MISNDTKNMESWANSVWPMAKSIMESVLVSTRLLISTLESNIGFVRVEIDNIENFIENKLRSVIYDIPDKETEGKAKRVRLNYKLY